MKDIYKDGTYLKMAPSWHTEDSKWKAQKIIQGIQKAGLDPKTICDVGCGAGEVLLALGDSLNKDVRLVGYDPSPQASQFQKKQGNLDISFIQDDFLKHSNERYDLLLVIDVLEHVPDYIGFLEGLRHHSDNIIFHIPMDLTVLNLLNPFALTHIRNTLGHLHYFDRERALAALTDCGYKIKCEFFTNWIEELPHRASVESKLRRRLAIAKFLFGRRKAVQYLGGHSLLVVAGCN